MRFMLDTNILIPLQDSTAVLRRDLADFVRIAQSNGHTLVFHEASRRDIARDKDLERRRSTLQRLYQYEEISGSPECPWNNNETTENDSVDNEILYSLSLEAADYLITEDIEIHKKSKKYNVNDRVMAIQEASNFLKSLYERESVSLPNIQDIPIFSLMPELDSAFFDSLVDDYSEFKDWFRKKAREGRRAWVVRENDGNLAGLCIYNVQRGIQLEDGSCRHKDNSLKLCTFKVGEQSRGKKIGELFLKAAFKYSIANSIESIFITAKPNKQVRLVQLLQDFGFASIGRYSTDTVYVKEMPITAPQPTPLMDLSSPFEYHRQYFPHFLENEIIKKFIIPIRPSYHRILFPDFTIAPGHSPLFEYLQENSAGNAIKLAYICHAKTKQIEPGDILLLYRSQDFRAITTIGIAEHISDHSNSFDVARIVKRRTAYGMLEIEKLVEESSVKVILFRSITHLPAPIKLSYLLKNGVIRQAPQSIMKIGHLEYSTRIKPLVSQLRN